MKRDIDEISTPDIYHLTDLSPALEIYANETFDTSTGQTVLQGGWQARDFYRSVTLSVVDGQLLFPAVEDVDTTEDSPNNQLATYSAYIRVAGRKPIPWLLDFSIPPTAQDQTSISWTTLRIHQSGVIARERTTLSSDEVYAYVDLRVAQAIGSLNDASATVKGRTRLSLNPALADEPIAVGANDYAALTNAGITKLSVAPASASAPIAVGDNDPRIAGTSVFNVMSYGAVCDGVTDDTVAVTAAKTAAEASGKGAILFFPGPCLMRKLTAGGELLLIRKALILQGVGKDKSGIFASTDTPDTVRLVRYNPLGWPDTKGFTIRDMAITSAGRCEGNPLSGGCAAQGGEWFQGPSISGGDALVFDSIGAANTYSIQDALIENCLLGPTASGIAIYGTASSTNGVPAASSFNSLDIFGTVKWDSAGDSITFRGGRQVGPGYAHDVTMVAGATKYSIIDPNITSDGGVIFRNGIAPQIIGGIIEIYKSWRTPEAYGTENGAVVDFAGSPGDIVYAPLILGTVVNSTNGSALNGVRFDRTQNGVMRTNYCHVETGKFCMDNTSNANATFWDRNLLDPFADPGAGLWLDPAGKLQLGIAGFATDLGPTNDLTGNLALIGNGRFTAKDTSSPARLQLNFTNSAQDGEVQFLINNVSVSRLRQMGSTSARPNELELVNAVSLGGISLWTNNVRRWIVENDGDLVTLADNAYKIGATSSGRPSEVNAGTLVRAPTVNAVTEFQVNGAALNFSDLAGSLNFSALAGAVAAAQNTLHSGTGTYKLLPTDFLTSNATSPVGAANEVRVFRFFLRQRATFLTLKFEIVATDAGDFAAVAIYNSAGTTKLMDSGAQTTDAAGIKSGGSPTTLDPGYYWMAWTGSSTTLTFRALSPGTSVLINDGTVHLGVAANASVAGVMPATLGVITGNPVISTPYVKLQG